ncbi:MAG: hypothetical protein RLZZ142_959, partial [Verrucomicrobiota bacterium]
MDPGQFTQERRQLRERNLIGPITQRLTRV